MTAFAEQYSTLTTTLKQVLGDSVATITTDLAQVRPNRVSILISPPSLAWSQWDDPDFTFTIFVIAGVPWKQDTALPVIHQIIQQLSDSKTVNLSTGEPATITITEGTLAAYELTLNPF